MKNLNLIINKCRIVGNFCAISGYFVLLHINPLIGSLIRVLGFCLIIPFCWKNKLWDFFFTIGFFGIIDLSFLIKILIWKT